VGTASPPRHKVVTVTLQVFELSQRSSAYLQMAVQISARGGQVAAHLGLGLAGRYGFVEFPWQNGLVLNTPLISKKLFAWLGENPKLPADIDLTILTVSLQQHAYKSCSNLFLIRDKPTFWTTWTSLHCINTTHVSVVLSSVCATNDGKNGLTTNFRRTQITRTSVAQSITSFNTTFSIFSWIHSAFE
jgi:hypothetical protein